MTAWAEATMSHPNSGTFIEWTGAGDSEETRVVNIVLTIVIVLYLVFRIVFAADASVI